MIYILDNKDRELTSEELHGAVFVARKVTQDSYEIERCTYTYPYIPIIPRKGTAYSQATITSIIQVITDLQSQLTQSPEPEEVKKIYCTYRDLLNMLSTLTLEELENEVIIAFGDEFIDQLEDFHFSYTTEDWETANGEEIHKAGSLVLEETIMRNYIDPWLPISELTGNDNDTQILGWNATSEQGEIFFYTESKVQRWSHYSDEFVEVRNVSHFQRITAPKQ